MAYREYAPCRELADLVACTWERPVPRNGGRAAQRVVPDAAVDLVWRGAQLVVAGPDRSAVMSPLVPGETVVGLRLRPGIAGSALGMPASDLSGARVALQQLWGRSAAELEERIAAATTTAAQRRLLEDALVARRATMHEPDPLVLAAAARLGLPGSRVHAISRELATSERQLLRRFRAAVGYGPKTMDRVLRFQRFLVRSAAVTRGDEALARIASELGYADQAHLTRDCVQLSGLTPAGLAGAWTSGDGLRAPTTRAAKARSGW